MVVVYSYSYLKVNLTGKSSMREEMKNRLGKGGRLRVKKEGRPQSGRPGLIGYRRSLAKSTLMVLPSSSESFSASMAARASSGEL